MKRHLRQGPSRQETHNGTTPSSIRIQRITNLLAAIVIVTTVLSTPSVFGQNLKWKQGDVILGVGGGTWKVVRPTTNTVVDSIADSLASAGVNNGSAVDNTWHLLGTDSGSALNKASLVRFRISPHDPTNQVQVTDVLSVVNGSAGTNSVNPVALMVAGTGNIILANATPATIAIFGTTGNLISSFALGNRVIDRALASADLWADGNSVLYTSGGSTIRRLQISGTQAGTVTTFASLPGQRLFGVRVVPACASCASGTGVLVAAGDSIFLLDGSSAATVKEYTIAGQSNIRVLALDPVTQDPAGNKYPPEYFWAASPTSGALFQVRFSTAASQSFSSGASGVFSIATYGGFSANQPSVTEFPVAQAGSSPSTTATYLYSANNTSDQLTLTGYGTPFTTNLRVFASSVPSSTGNSDDGLPCTPTVSGLCTIWEIGVDPPLPSGALMALKILSQPGPADALLYRTLLLRNQREDVTTAVRNQDPAGGSRFSVYSLNNRANESDKGCAYFPPVVEGATLSNPGNVTFRFQCTQLPGTQLQTLSPRISVVQSFSGAAPLPFFPGVSTLTGGTCCTVAKYRYDAQSNTWVINVSFSGVTGASSFVATTFDDNHLASSFDVAFTVQK